MRQILEAHGHRLKAVIEDALGKGAKTKFVITKQDESVCLICQAAERQGPIPAGALYNNGMMEPKFHKHCRCIQATSEELGASLEVRATDDRVDVGIFTPAASHAASIREYGLGNSPPNPIVQRAMANIDEHVFDPLLDDLHEKYKKIFMR